MKNRLEVTREFLREDGVVFVQCDDNEQAYLKVLMDEVFGRENFINNIIWQKKYAPSNDAKWISDNHDLIILFSKNKSRWLPNLADRTDEQKKRYKNPDNDPRGDWKPGGLDAKTYSSQYDYPIKTPSGRMVSPPKGSCWRYSEKQFDLLVKDNRIWFGESGNNVPSIKRFLSEVREGIVPLTMWLHKEVGHNQEATQEFIDLNIGVFSSPKPERLIQKIIHIATKPNDLVLDFCLGSGTTAAVAHKMGRQYVGIEQMDYIEDITVKRLKKVIGSPKKTNGKMFDELDYDKGGISESVDWKGGGSFLYFELKKNNEDFIDHIQKAEDTKTLFAIWEAMKEKSFIDYNLDLKKHDAEIEAFKQLTLNQQKQHLCEILDKNQIYVNLSSLDDADFQVSKEDKQLTKDFYQI